MAHELGHYYFGSVISPNSTLQWAFLEGITEYLSLQAIRDLVGKDYYDRQIKRYAGASKKMQDFVPLKNITIGSQINQDYRYNYVPLLLTALEQQIGKQQIWNWLSTVLRSQHPVTNYQFFKKSILDSGVDEQVFTSFEEKYLAPLSSLQDLLYLFRSTSTHYYYWGLSKESVKKGAPNKPHAFYTSIKSIPLDDSNLKKIAQQYKYFSIRQCRPTNETCSSDFNTYDNLEDARNAQAKWLKNLSGEYILKQVDFQSIHWNHNANSIMWTRT
ncbi:hypothetical protein [Dyadobacter alkalitolerans]|uniref:hypothetical protein n=1 Tax=Dyadobacter alkalitolerans TaxID=492736 RepID=UPI000683DEB5|nr:hypothetical protein [Dyadobacter alkalitolerans]